MIPIEVVRKINEEIERVEHTLPESGRRFEILEVIVPRDYYEVLLQDDTFKQMSLINRQNLGGIPVILGNELKIVFIQGDKKKRPWARREVEWENLESVNMEKI